MKWLWVAVVVLAGTYGDVLSAKGMSERGEIHDFHPSATARVMRYIVTNREVLTGIVTNAISFVGFLALLSVAPLSFAAPATAVSYILKTLLAHFYLHETVNRSRWIGVALVAGGVVLISF